MDHASSLPTQAELPPLKPLLQKLLMWVALIAAGFVLIPVGLFGMMLLLRDVLPQTNIGVLYLPFFMLMLLFTSSLRFLVITGLVLVVSFTALAWAKPGLKAAIWLLAGIASIVAIVILTGSYEPAIIARTERQMVVATAPTNFVERISRQAQVFAEGRTCTYDLLGWGADGRFFYTSICDDTIDWDVPTSAPPASRAGTIWAIDPASETRPNRIIEVPASLSRNAIQDWDALAYMDAPNVEPEEVRAMTTSLYLKLALKSEDGRWIAALTEHLYGPQDVVLIEIAD